MFILRKETTGMF